MSDEVFWIVWKEGGGPSYVKHDSRRSALNEAERLAVKHPGGRFYVLEADSVSHTPPPVVTTPLCHAF